MIPLLHTQQYSQSGLVYISGMCLRLLKVRVGFGRVWSVSCVYPSLICKTVNTFVRHTRTVTTATAVISSSSSITTSTTTIGMLHIRQLAHVVTGLVVQTAS